MMIPINHVVVWRFCDEKYPIVYYEVFSVSLFLPSFNTCLSCYCSWSIFLESTGKIFVSNSFAWLVPNKSSKISGLFLTESWTGLSILVYNCQRVTSKILLLPFMNLMLGLNSLIKALIWLNYSNKTNIYYFAFSSN